MMRNNILNIDKKAEISEQISKIQNEIVILKHFKKKLQNEVYELDNSIQHGNQIKNNKSCET